MQRASRGPTAARFWQSLHLSDLRVDPPRSPRPLRPERLMIKKAALILALVTAPALLTAQGIQGTFPAPAVGASTAALYELFNSYWEWRLAQEPELATSVGRNEYNDRWRDWSKPARDRARAARQEFLQQLLYVGSGNLTPADRLSAHP